MKKTYRSGHCGQGWGRRLSRCLRQNLLRRAQHNEAHQGHNESLEARRDLQSGGYVAHAESPPRMNVADESSLDARRVRV